MSHQSWRTAVTAIAKLTCNVSSTQLKLARIAGISLPARLPTLVAAARLQSLLSPHLNLRNSVPYEEAEFEYLLALELPRNRAQPRPQDRRELVAWIQHLRLLRRRAALKKLALIAGDIVEVEPEGVARVEEVSSIGSDGRVYFKGGNSAGAWPDQLEVRLRKDDLSSRGMKLRRIAANNAAARGRVTHYWSDAKHAQLKAFEVKRGALDSEVDRLEEVVAEASDEAPIQQFLQEHPQLLTTLLGGRFRYCRPQVRLGSHYVADFMLADVDSRGVRWILVELETPNSSVTLTTSNELEAHARKGVSQIEEWRDWLQSNLASAMAPRAQNGLGLVDIRPNPDGLVLVGRRELLLENAAAIRHRIREERRIQIRTYDGLVESLRGTLRHSGTPALNPFGLEDGSAPEQ